MIAVLIFGIVTCLIGLAGLGLCIRRAAAIRKLDDKDEVRRRLHGLVALNMGSVAVAFLGLALVVVGIVLRQG